MNPADLRKYLKWYNNGSSRIEGIFKSTYDESGGIKKIFILMK
jgi:hypothetical protein